MTPLRSRVLMALDEDLPNLDLMADRTTFALDLGDLSGSAELIAKQDLIMSGSRAFALTVRTLDPQAQLTWFFKDGQKIMQGQVVCLLQTDLQRLLAAERVAMNFIGRLSGVATLTSQFVEQLHGTNCQILDTRKTTPLWRDLERAAVRHGGGCNHRKNLRGKILVKENHIRACGSIKACLQRLSQHLKDQVSNSEADDNTNPPHLPIIVEVSSFLEAQIAFEFWPERVLLDNMCLSEMESVKKICPPRIQLEASGNMTVERVREVALTCVDFISVGALTHSAPCADLSLMFKWDGSC